MKNLLDFPLLLPEQAQKLALLGVPRMTAVEPEHEGAHTAPFDRERQLGRRFAEDGLAGGKIGCGTRGPELIDQHRLLACPDPQRGAGGAHAGHPLIEGLLVRNEATGKRGVTLINWAYRQKSLVPFKDLRVAIRGSGPVARATSVVLGAELKVERSGDVVTVLLPALEEGDVLRLE